jgi:DNA modification methylase
MILPGTTHQILVGSAEQQMAKMDANSVNLIVTSPPYPMIEMWDNIMAEQNTDISSKHKNGKGPDMFEMMHHELDKVWQQVERVLFPGGFVCINIGDATRTINDHFSLYNNHSRIVSAFIKLGFTNLPNIIWRKQTNAPNKFMGSGMLPGGAYVTLEHEWILIFRKGGKRLFKSEIDKQLRRESAFFWEERNTWFSDLWDLKGTKQKIETPESRNRSAAYPFEIPYRLINMYSVKGDTVLDPFLGTGTTTLSAIASQRNSIGIEIDPSFIEIVDENMQSSAPVQLNRYIQNRIEQHKLFVEARSVDMTKDDIKHFNKNLGMPVTTSQEVELKLSYIDDLEKITATEYQVKYKGILKREDLIIKKRPKDNYQEILNL